MSTDPSGVTELIGISDPGEPSAQNVDLPAAQREDPRATASLTASVTGSTGPVPDPNRVVRVFVSHKGKDAQLAANLKATLETLGNRRLHVFVSSTLPWAERWEATVYAELQAADWLLLLYSDPDERWDWCVYEGGFFVGHNSAPSGAPDAITLGKKVFVLHADKVHAPDPFRCFQAYGANEARIAELVKQIYVDPIAEGVAPINPLVVPPTPVFNTVRDLLLEVAGKKPECHPFLAKLDVAIPSSRASAFREGGPMPPDVYVSGEPALFIVGPRLQSIISWKDLEEFYSIPAGTLDAPPVGPSPINTPTTRESRMSEWFGQLTTALREIARGKRSSGALPMLRSYHEPAISYCPAVETFTVRADGSFRFQIVFVDVPQEVRTLPPGPLGVLTQVTMLARMFRFGVVEPFANAIRNAQVHNNVADLAIALRDVVGRMRTVEVESANCGMDQFTTVQSGFEGPPDPGQSEQRLGELSRLVQQWIGLRKVIITEAENPAPDFAVCTELMIKMRSLNTQFFRLAATRYAQLVLELPG